jgi:hypothetical protein
VAKSLAVRRSNGLIPTEEDAIDGGMAETGARRLDRVENEIRMVRVSDSDGVRSVLVPMEPRRGLAHHMDSDMPI